MPTSCSVHGRHHPLVEGKNAENRVARIVRALHRLEGKQVSVRVRNGVSVPPVLLGLTHIQSISGLAVCVPFVSMAISNSTLWTASIKGWSNCRRGSPPVHTTNGLEYPRYCGQVFAIAAAKVSAVSKRPPPVPSVPTKSVSQNWHTALLRSSSRPDQRLQPANRQKTAGRPV